MDSLQSGNRSGQDRHHHRGHGHPQSAAATAFYNPRDHRRDQPAVTDAQLTEFGSEFLVPWDADQPGAHLTNMDVPLYNPNCWPADWITDMLARGEDVYSQPIRVPHHPDAPSDAPLALNFHADAHAIALEDAHRFEAGLTELSNTYLQQQQQQPARPQRKKHVRRADRRGNGDRWPQGQAAGGGDAGYVVDSDGDVVMMDEDAHPQLTQIEIERHTIDSFRAELAKDPSAKVTLSVPPPPPHLLPPRSFTYHSGLIFTATCPAPDPAFLLGCDCKSTRPCILPSGRINPACKHGDDAYGHATTPAYTSDGRLRLLVQLQNSTFLSVSSPFVIECNVNCACARFASASAAAASGSTCKNRVAQHGIRYRLVIGHAAGKGLGVFAAERIPQGAFVVEYAGEVLTQDELRARDEEWATKVGGGGGQGGRAVRGTTTYSFNADWMVDGSNEKEMGQVKAIEARYRGNCARFFNHSCSPNLIVGAIQYDMDDPYMHRIGFFALRDIAAGEELAFDYHGGDRSTEPIAEGRGSRRSTVVGKVGRKRTGRRRRQSGLTVAASGASAVDDEEDEDGLTGLYKFRCLCGSDKCRGNVL